MSSSYRWTVLGLGVGFVFLCFTGASIFVSGLVFCVYCISFPFVFGCQYQCNWLPGKTRHRIDLLCVEWDVISYTLTHSLVQMLAARDRYRAMWWYVHWLFMAGLSPVLVAQSHLCCADVTTHPCIDFVMSVMWPELVSDCVGFNVPLDT